MMAILKTVCLLTCVSIAAGTGDKPDRRELFGPRRRLGKDKMSCAAGSPSSCKVTNVPVSGYSAGDLIRVSNGLKVSKSTEKNSCPSEWKIWSPRNKNDWTLVYNALGKKTSNYPAKPHLIVDVTRSANGCGGCKEYAMKSTVSQQSSWKTSDGSAWWLRDTKYSEPNGDYHANCFLWITKVDPNDVQFNDGNCGYSSTDYLCQAVASTLAHWCQLVYLLCFRTNSVADLFKSGKSIVSQQCGFDLPRYCMGLCKAGFGVSILFSGYNHVSSWKRGCSR